MASISAEQQSPTGIKFYFNDPWKLIKTASLILTWIMLGFHAELVGPTLPLLAANIDVAYTDMGSVLASRAAGYLTANILGAVLQNIVAQYSDGLLVCAFILPAIVVFATPFVTSLILMCVLFFVQGIAQSFTDLGGTHLLLTMWGARAAVPLNLVHLGFGIGAVLVNLLVRPFLSQKSLLMNVTSIDEGMNSTLSSANMIMAKSNIVIPYSITAVLCALLSVMHIFFFIKALKNQRQKLDVQQIDYAAVSNNSEHDNGHHRADQETSSRIGGRGHVQYVLCLSIIFICYSFFIGGNEQTFSKFFFTYLKSEQFHISNSGASWGIILYWLSYSIGRLMGAILSMFFSVTMCLNIVWCGGLCLAIAWLIFVWTIGLTATSLFILGAGTGLVFSPIVPLSFALYNQRLNVAPMLLALLLSGSALGAVIFQKIAGYVMDHNPNHFPTLLIVCIMISIILYVISHAVHFIYERNIAAKARLSVTNGAALARESLGDEEREMSNYLRNKEHK